MTRSGPEREGKGTRRRSVLALYWCIVAVLILLVPEATIRLFNLEGDPYARADRELGWFHIPGRSGRYVSSQARSHFHINALGLSGPDRPYSKAPGSKRVLLLGDSFTESLQVPYERSWAHFLEESLGPPWEVLNGGVAGYGTDNELLFLRKEGWRYQPDLVFLLFFTGNDYSDNEHGLSLRTGQSLPKPYFTDEGDSLRLHDFPLPAPRRGPLRWLQNLLKEHSRFYLFLRTRIHEWRSLRGTAAGGAHQVPLAWEVYRRSQDEEWTRAIRVSGALLNELREETAARGIPLAVGILPTGWRVDRAELTELLRKYPTLADSSQWDFAGPDRRLEEILRREGIPFVQLEEKLRETGEQEDVRMYGDHLTLRGHEVVASESARLIRSIVQGGKGDLPQRGGY